VRIACFAALVRNASHDTAGSDTNTRVADRVNTGTQVARIARTRTLVNMAVPDSLVTGCEDLINTLTLKDPDDRHVLAAAIRCDADTIVTFNQEDFDEEELAKYSVYTQHPDEFVSNRISLYTPKVISVSDNCGPSFNPRIPAR